jgi:hypothetical protein
MSKMKNVMEKIEKSAKAAKAVKPVERTHFDCFSKTRGYMCSCLNEDHAIKTLQSLYYENDRYWRQARADGKKTRPFDCYAIARTGYQERLIELQFAAEEDEGETYEEIAEKEMA